MSGRELPKVADAEKESFYGFVFGVSGPGEIVLHIMPHAVVIIKHSKPSSCSAQALPPTSL